MTVTGIGLHPCGEVDPNDLILVLVNWGMTSG